MVKNRLIKLFLLSVTATLFILYFLNNKSEFNIVTSLGVFPITVILISQLSILASNVLLLIIVGQYLKKKIGITNSVKITAYSSIVNFFGFLQGGLGVRGVMLKKIHGISYKNYTITVLVYYFMLFSISGLLVLAGYLATSNIVQIIKMSLYLSLLFSFLALLYRFRAFGAFGSKLEINYRKVLELLRSKYIFYIFFAVILQLIASASAYATELNSVGADITASGLAIYIGISQFSILIAITPGAIGIREGLLLLAQTQMVLSSSDIILAATIDRLIYFFALLIIAPIAFSMRKNTLAKF